jgi:hypothetical protein
MEYVFPNSPVIEWQHFLSIVAKKKATMTGLIYFSST